MSQIIIQSIGVLGFALFALSFFIKSRKRMLISQSISLLIIVVHFSLLSAWTGAAITFANSIKIFLFSFNAEKKWASQKYWLYLFLAMFVIFGIVTWEGYHSLLPIAAMTFNTLAYWQKDQIRIKLIFAPQSILWFIYDFMVGSYAGMVAEATIFSAAIISLIKNEVLKK